MDIGLIDCMYFLYFIVGDEVSCRSGIGRADAAALKYLYVTLIRSKLDHGSVAYRSAAKSFLAWLDAIQVQASRVCLGTGRTSPVCALQVHAGEKPLTLRHLLLPY